MKFLLTILHLVAPWTMYLGIEDPTLTDPDAPSDAQAGAEAANAFGMDDYQDEDEAAAAARAQAEVDGQVAETPKKTLDEVDVTIPDALPASQPVDAGAAAAQPQTPAFQIGDARTSETPDATQGSEDEAAAIARIQAAHTGISEDVARHIYQQETVVSQSSGQLGQAATLLRGMLSTPEGRAAYARATGQQIPEPTPAPSVGQQPGVATAPAGTGAPQGGGPRLQLTGELKEQYEALQSEGRTAEAAELLLSQVDRAVDERFQHFQQQQQTTQQAQNRLHEVTLKSQQEMAQLNAVLGEEWTEKYHDAVLETQRRAPGLSLAENVLLNALGTGDTDTVQRIMSGKPRAPAAAAQQFMESSSSTPQAGTNEITRVESDSLRILGIHKEILGNGVQDAPVDDVFGISDL